MRLRGSILRFWMGDKGWEEGGEHFFLCTLQQD